MPAQGIVLVTGASGYVAGHVVSQLLAAGHHVRGTVRDAQDVAKTSHLRALPHAAERLELVEANLLEPASLVAAAKGCVACMHTASPFFNSSVEEDSLLKPAVEGTLGVLRACHAAGVHRVVLTSSTAAVFVKVTQEGHVFTEEDWSDEEMMRQNRVLYPLSKTLAERAAWEFAAEHKDLSLVVVSTTETAVDARRERGRGGGGEGAE